MRAVLLEVLVPLHRALGEGQAILSAEEIKSVFSTFELICQTNESFLKCLQDSDPPSDLDSSSSSSASSFSSIPADIFSFTVRVFSELQPFLGRFVFIFFLFQSLFFFLSFFLILNFLFLASFSQIYFICNWDFCMLPLFGSVDRGRDGRA